MEEKGMNLCPYCGMPLSKWRCPPESAWGTEFQYVCFNDDCSYFVNGWEWMREHYNMNVSYRFRINPVNGEHGPLPVWSKNALKDLIITG
jgi:hypothetical protein